MNVSDQNLFLLIMLVAMLPINYTSGECHYWYRRFPATPSVCQGTNQTTTVTLVCEVQYWSLNSSDSIQVRWYRSRDEETAGIEGKILYYDEIKYQQSNSTQTRENQTIIGQYVLGILRFNSSDRGYYWCQMVVNNVSLSPSPYGHINGSQCTALDAICEIDQPICAQNTCAQYMALKKVNGCLLMKFSNISSTRTTTISSMATKDIASFPTAEVASAIVAGIILLVLTIIVVSSIIYVKKHRSESELIIHDNHIKCTSLSL